MFERLKSALRLDTHASPYTVVDLAQDMGYSDFVPHGDLANWSMTTRAALEIPVVLSCARVIAEDIAKLDKMVMRETEDGLEEVDHDINYLLSVSPNDYMTAFEFWEFLQWSAVLDHGGFAYINYGPKGQVVELLPLRPSMVQVKQDKKYRTVYRVSDGKRLIGEYTRKNILHIRGPSMDGLHGLTIPYQTRRALTLLSSMEKSQVSFHVGGGRPSGVLTFEKGLSPEARARIRDQFRSLSQNKGTAILDGKAQYHALDASMKDGDMVELRRATIKEVTGTFRIHPQKIGETSETTTYASAESFNNAHADDAIMPWAKRGQQAVQMSMLHQGRTGRDLRYVMDMALLRRGSTKEQAEADAIYATNRIRNRNEIRRSRGWKTIEGQDELPFPNEVALAKEDDGSSEEENSLTLTEQQSSLLKEIAHG